jgi:hypothetical protein
LTRLEGAADRAVRRLGIKPGSNAPKPMSILEYAAKKAAEQAKILLREAGCYFVRQGRGDHEIWHSPISGINFTIDNNIKSRHTANVTLKQAGLPKHF